MVECNLLKNNKTLMKEYNYNKNQNFDINKLTLGSDKKILWICEKGHEWEASIGSRNRTNAGCPICSNRIILKGYNDLETLYPVIAKEWNYEKNEIKPNEVGVGSGKKVWWKCEKGHEWKSTIVNRTKLSRGCPYCTNQKILEGYNDLTTINPKLAKEWNYKKNTISPTKIGAGTRKKYWWKCEKGHEWMASPSNRHRLNVGCPFCSQSTSFPEKAIYYYMKKYFENIIPNYRSPIINNKEIDIYLPNEKIGIEYDGLAFHNKIKNNEKDLICQKRGIKIIHVAEKHKSSLKISNNYIYYDPVNKYKLNEIINYLLNLLLKTNGNDYKINIEKDQNKIFKIIEKEKKENALFNTNPALDEIWNYEKNDGLNPNMFSKGSKLTVWWKCENNHEWRASICNVARGSRCPYCSNRVAITNENDIFSISYIYKKLWNYEKNIGVNPRLLKSNSNVKVWWKCEKGHEWKATPASITRGSRCPYCSGSKVFVGFNDLFTTYPSLKKEWYYEKNSISPYEVSAGSGKKVWWKCEKGHEWESTIANRTKLNRGCPICGRAKAWETRKKNNK